MNHWDPLPEENISYGEYLAGYIGQSPSPYHASKNLGFLLEDRGFERLEETEEWNLERDGKYYVVRNDTALIAFRNGSNHVDSEGIRMICAHLDSPCLKLNPNATMSRHGYEQLSAEVYGSALLRTWFDRDLSIAGRIFFGDERGRIRKCLFDAMSPVAVIPSIAIHLERKANEVQEINAQTQLNPVFATELADSNRPLERLLMETEGQVASRYDGNHIFGHDLYFYDTNKPRVFGPSGEFLSSARIDNLLSCFAGAIAICEADTENFCMLILSDHEEVGSISDSGASGTFVTSVLERTIGLDSKILRNSILLSADGAHGIHPNYPEKHDWQHAPVLNQGVVIKTNANQSYSTSGETLALIDSLCNQLGFESQKFVSRSDMRCGTTIGPIIASKLGIKTADVGVAQFAMHSIRELAGTQDALELEILLRAFMESEHADFYV